MCLMLILALIHSSLWPFVMNLPVGMSSRIICGGKLLFSRGSVLFRQTSGDTSMLELAQATSSG